MDKNLHVTLPEISNLIILICVQIQTHEHHNKKFVNELQSKTKYMHKHNNIFVKNKFSTYTNNMSFATTLPWHFLHDNNVTTAKLIENPGLTIPQWPLATRLIMVKYIFSKIPKNLLQKSLASNDDDTRIILFWQKCKFRIIQLLSWWTQIQFQKIWHVLIASNKILKKCNGDLWLL